MRKYLTRQRSGRRPLRFFLTLLPDRARTSVRGLIRLEFSQESNGDIGAQKFDAATPRKTTSMSVSKLSTFPLKSNVNNKLDSM